MAYEYYGHEATVLPDNTHAMLHFNDQFLRREELRQSKKAAAEKDETDRQIRLQKYIGDRLDAKDYSPVIGDDLKTTLEELQGRIKKGDSEVSIMGRTDQMAGNLAMKSAKVKNGEAKIAARIAELSKEDPNLDATALANIASINFHKKKDANGNWVRKTAEEMDDEADYVGDAMKEHWFELYSPKNSAGALSKALDDEKLQEIDIPTTYKETGEVDKLGVKGKVAAGLVGQSVDANGKTSYEVYHKNYRLPDTNKDFLDKDGKPVKVASDSIFSKYYQGAIGADIERQVRAELGKVADFNGSGDSMFSPDSDYADMLRRKLLYEKLQESVQGKYILNPGEDKSLQNKMAIWGKKMQQAQLDLSRQSKSLAERKFAWEKQKYKNEHGDEVEVEPYTDKVEREKAKEITLPNGQKIKYVETKDIDKSSLRVITGNKILADGTEQKNGVKPIKLPDGREGFVIDENGNWMGADDQFIDREEAYKRQLDEVKDKDKKIKAPVRKGIIQTIKEKFTPAAKKPAATTIKGSDKKLF